MAGLVVATGAEVTPSGSAAGRHLAGLLSAPFSQAHVLLLFEGRPRLFLLQARGRVSRYLVTRPLQLDSQLCYALGQGQGQRRGRLSPVSQLLLRHLS